MIEWWRLGIEPGIIVGLPESGNRILAFVYRPAEEAVSHFIVLAAALHAG